MEKGKQYITQINKTDLDELADVANIHSGEGINAIRGDSGIEISIDKQSLQMWVKRIIAGFEI